MMLSKKESDEDQVALNLAHQIGITPHSTDYCLNLHGVVGQQQKFKLSHSRLFYQHYLAKEARANLRNTHIGSTQSNKQQGSLNQTKTHNMLSERKIATSQAARREHDKQWRINTTRTARRPIHRFQDSDCLTHRKKNSQVVENKTLLVRLWHTQANPINPQLISRIGVKNKVQKVQKTKKGKSTEPRIKYNSTVKSFEFY